VASFAAEATPWPVGSRSQLVVPSGRRPTDTITHGNILASAVSLFSRRVAERAPICPLLRQSGCVRIPSHRLDAVAAAVEVVVFQQGVFKRHLTSSHLIWADFFW